MKQFIYLFLFVFINIFSIFDTYTQIHAIMKKLTIFTFLLCLFLDPNIPKTRIPSETGTVNYRIPDRLTPFALDEVKNVSYLDYIPQLQDFVQYSQRNNLQMILHIRPENTIFGPATSFSPAMQNAIYQYNIIVRTIPFGVTLFRITF